MKMRNVILIAGGMLTFVCLLCVALIAIGALPKQPPAAQVAPTAQPIALAVVTETPAATDTLRPSLTPRPTRTLTHTPRPRPSNTRRPTNTPGPTDTPSNTPTITPTPSKTPTPTRTPIPTRTPLPTRTPDPRSQYSAIDIRELESYADNHIGELVRLEGRVFNVGSDFYQIWVRKPGSYSDVAVIITYIGMTPPSGIYEDTRIVVYGTVMGTLEGTNAFGGTIRQPWVDADIIEKR